MIKIQEGIFYDGNDIAWKRDVGDAKQVFNKTRVVVFDWSTNGLLGVY